MQWGLEGGRILRRVLRKGSEKGRSRRHLDGRNKLFQEYDPLGVCPELFGHHQDILKLGPQCAPHCISMTARKRCGHWYGCKEDNFESTMTAHLDTQTGVNSKRDMHMQRRFPTCRRTIRDSKHTNSRRTAQTSTHNESSKPTTDPLCRKSGPEHYR